MTMADGKDQSVLKEPRRKSIDPRDLGSGDPTQLLVEPYKIILTARL